VLREILGRLVWIPLELHPCMLHGPSTKAGPTPGMSCERRLYSRRGVVRLLHSLFGGLALSPERSLQPSIPFRARQVPAPIMIATEDDAYVLAVPRLASPRKID
jgi:hypothetical protein